MLYSLALIVLFGMAASWLFEKLGLPGLLGMLVAGVVIGPWGLNLITSDIIAVSGDFRKLALIVILLRAGLGLRKETLSRVGASAAMLSFLPSLFEGIAVLFLSIVVFGFNFITAGILGFAIVAVSPAVVVPAMLDYLNKGFGRDKGIPTLILAGSSVDAIFAITVFSTFLGFYTREKMSAATGILDAIGSVATGAILGLFIGLLLVYLFKKFHIRDTRKVLIILGLALLMTVFEEFLKDSFSISSLLGIMVMGFLLLEKVPAASGRIATKLGKIWILAEIVLFVLIGGMVNVTVLFDSGLSGLLIILAGLVFRSIGVMLSTIRSRFTLRERVFCVISYIPKGTVQAAIGSVPLALGVKGGELILAMAVLSIIITAPLGAIGIRIGAKKLLSSPVEVSRGQSG